jgi:hypothetical protein
MATQVVTVTRAITDGQGRASIAVSTVALCLLVTITPSLTAQRNCPIGRSTPAAQGSNILS